MNFTRSIRSSVTRYNPETWTYQANIIANSGTISSTSLAAVDAFVTACKTANLWSKILDCGVFVGNQLAAALTKLVTDSGSPYLTNENFVGGDYTETGVNGGLTPNGSSKYLKTGVLANAAGVAALAFYNRGVVDNSAERTMIGTEVNSTDRFSLGHLAAPEDVFSFNAQNIVANQNNQTGLYIADAIAGSDYRIFLNGNQLVSYENALTNPNIGTEFYVFAVNDAGTAAEFWSTIGSFYAICQALSAADAANLSAAVITLQLALNRL